MSYRDNLAMKIATANSFELVVLQYQALIENTQDLKIFIEQNDKVKSFEKLDKIRDILSNLIASLGKEEDEFKQNTIDLYLYINKTLNEASIKRDLSNITRVINIFETLRDAWYEANKNLNPNSKRPVSKNIYNDVTYGKKVIDVQGSINDFGRA